VTTILVFAFVGFWGGVIAGVLANWSSWARIVDDFYWHGRDNHLCEREGCCR